MNVSLKYEPSTSSKRNEHYTFVDIDHYCTIVTARLFVPVELVIYHDRKEFNLYHIYENDVDIMDDIFECIYDNLINLDAQGYVPREVTNGNFYFIKYMQKKYGIEYECY